ncbi:hypothetical protein DBV05_g10536 [Lasiodiplodia theobromae]|uniref:Heterokaryon incompatibility domain-containing protein n=1 Tax=Lasiodiplodia theobromae TaxID=45133 RepID=A0A5N5CZM9_9PEZI|nr:hypothetical protein DBV05_g10536 [Lasiodiplodia theobromae]
MFCKYCRESVLESTQRWAYHHKTYQNLKASAVAEEPCAFCRVLYEDVRLAAEAFDEPLYRWSITRPAAIRESQEPVVITFRPTRPIKIATPTDNIREEFPPEREFYMYPETDLTTLLPSSPLGPSTNSPQSWTQVSHWLQTCLSSHPRCNKPRGPDSFVPTRLLDVQHPLPGYIGLVETKSHPAFTSSSSSDPTSAPPVYCTLSHCWGPSPSFLRLRASNLTSFLRHGIRIGELGNRNFAHAVEACRQLGVRWLWIDSLCIVQHWVDGDEAPPDDAAHRALEEADWHHEAPFMHQVYRNSYCNIAAADSADAEGGLFRERGEKVGRDGGGSVTYKAARGEEADAVFGDRTWRVVSGDIWQTELLGTPLYARAWVFQERMLSPRLLHFTAHQLFWDCATLSACESFPSGLPQPLDAPAVTDRHWRARLLQASSSNNADHQKMRDTINAPLATATDISLEQFWHTAVSSYTRCALTRSSDRAVAVWGVAKPFRDAMLRERYAYGLWERGLEEQLAWKLENVPLPHQTATNTGTMTKNANAKRPTHAGPASAQPPNPFPSWSWMAAADVGGPVVLADRLPGRRSYMVKAHDGESVVAFELAAGFRKQRVKAETKFGTWKEQFGEWDKRMAEIEKHEERRRRMVVVAKGPTAGGGSGRGLGRIGEEDEEGEDEEAEAERLRDEHPQLASNSIALYGYVSRARCVYDAEREDYRLEIEGWEEDQYRVEAFPDMVLEHGATVYFMILAATAEVFEEEGWGDDYDEENEYDEDEDNEDDEDGVVEDLEAVENGEDAAEDDSDCAAEELDPLCDGVGIILQPAEGENHFRRIGALRFEATQKIMESTYLQVDTADLKGCDGERKYKIWLD